MATVFDRIRSIIVEDLGTDESEVTLEARFVDDLNADSLDLVELMMSLEEEFSTDDQKIDISDEEAEQITTVGAAVAFLKSKGIKDN